tara:strand:+ start:780 stop:893 length:114 start_codon:yes stop_codon:yes gene_type:complete
MSRSVQGAFGVFVWLFGMPMSFCVAIYILTLEHLVKA